VCVCVCERERESVCVCWGSFIKVWKRILRNKTCRCRRLIIVLSSFHLIKLLILESNAEVLSTFISFNLQTFIYFKDP